MKKYFMILLVLMVMMSTAYAEVSDIVITTGEKGKTYIRAGYSLASHLGIPNDNVITSKGSGENLKRIKTGEAQIGMTQADSYAAYLDKHPDFANKSEMLGTMYKECVYGAIRKKGKINDEGDLMSDKATVAIGKRGSGTNDTWKYMSYLQPGFGKAHVILKGGKRMLGKLAISDGKSDSSVDAVVWTERPSTNSKMVQAVLNNPKLKLIGFNNRKLNNKHKIIGKPIYEFEKVDLKKGWGGKYKTACFDAYIMASTEIEEDDLDEIADVVYDYGSKLVK